MELSQTTVRQYSRIADRLLRAYARERGQEWHVDPQAFSCWFMDKSRAGFWARRTFWIYKAAVVWFMERNGPVEAMEKLKATSARLRKSSSETSSKKLKKLSDKPWKNLSERLQASNKPLDRILLHWLEAGRCSGLRPCEWEHATIDYAAGTACLTVANAKRSDVRSNGVTRKLLFDPVCNREETASLQVFLRDIRGWTNSGKTFPDLYDKCRKRLYYVCRVLQAGLDQNSDLAISLYSPRHQFAADMKASGLSKAQVAALMGHASEESATIHYARRKDGRKRVPPRSPESEVDSVRVSGSARVALSWKNNGNDDVLQDCGATTLDIPCEKTKQHSSQ